MAVPKESSTSQVNQKAYIAKKVLEWIAYEKHITTIEPLDNKLSSTAKFVIDRRPSQKLFFWRGCHVQIIDNRFVFQNMKRTGDEIHLTGKPVEVEFPGENLDGGYEFY